VQWQISYLYQSFSDYFSIGRIGIADNYITWAKSLNFSISDEAKMTFNTSFLLMAASAIDCQSADVSLRTESDRNVCNQRSASSPNYPCHVA
jgi:hypothetical protein